MACGHARSSDETTPSVEERTFTHPQLLPADRPDFLALKPRALLGGPAAPLVEVLFPRAGRESLMNRSGLLIDEVERALFAFADSEHWVAVIRIAQAPEIVRANAARMLPLEIESDRPSPYGEVVRRVGYVEGARHEIIAIGDSTLWIGRDEGVFFAQRLSEIYAGSLPSSGATLRSLESEAELRYLHLGGVEESDSPISVLLSDLRALSLDIRPVGSDPARLDFEARLIGEFPEGAASNFQAIYAAIAASDLGRSVGLPSAELEVHVPEDRRNPALRLSLDVSRLQRAIEVLFLDEMQSLLDEPILDAPRPREGE